MQLKALDEADLRTYVLDHERGSAESVLETSIRALLRHTDGIPTRIDRSLKDLEVVSLPELVSSNSDLMPVAIEVTDETSPALAKAVRDLANSTDAIHLRSFSLLKVLSLFPQGEQLNCVKRFNSATGFYPCARYRTSRSSSD